MPRRGHYLLPIVLWLISWQLGCGKKVEIAPLPLDSYQRIAIVPFGADPDAVLLVERLDMVLGATLKKGKPEKTWIYGDVVHEWLSKNNELPADLWFDSNLAVQLGRSLEADLVLVGYVGNLQFDEEIDLEAWCYYSQRRGGTRVAIVDQKARCVVSVLAVDTRLGEVAWSCDELVGGVHFVLLADRKALEQGAYVLFSEDVKTYHVQQPEQKLKRIEARKTQILKHLAGHLSELAGHQIAPDVFEARPLTETVLDSPGAGGAVYYRSNGEPVKYDRTTITLDTIFDSLRKSR